MGCNQSTAAVKSIDPGQNGGAGKGGGSEGSAVKKPEKIISEIVKKQQNLLPSQILPENVTMYREVLDS